MGRCQGTCEKPVIDVVRLYCITQRLYYNRATNALAARMGCAVIRFEAKVDIDRQRELVTAALDYAAQGMHVFPVHYIRPDGMCSCGSDDCAKDEKNRGKHPLTKRGLNDASTDPARILEWWSWKPHANIGVRTGTASGFWVLDVDTGEEKPGYTSLLDLELQYGQLPKTRCVITGSQGKHYYFKIPDGATIPNSTSKIGPGLDVRCEGGYIIAPPSNHYTRNLYIPDDEASSHPIAAAPQWLVDMATAQETVSAAGTCTAASRVADTINGVDDGSRDTDLFKYACRLITRNTRAEVEMLVMQANSQCRPPLSDAVVLQKIESAYKTHGKKHPGWTPPGENPKPVADDPKTIQDAIDRCADVLSKIHDDPGLLARPETIDDLITVKNHAPADWLRAKGLLRKSHHLSDAERLMKKSRKQNPSHLRVVDNDSGDCGLPQRDMKLKTVINREIFSAAENDRPPDWAAISRVAFQWFLDHGAAALVTRNKIPIFFYDRYTYRPLGRPDERAAFHGLLFELTDLMQATTEGRKLAEGIANETRARGRLISEHQSWIFTDCHNCTVFVSLNNHRGEIAKITPNGVEILQNGNNEDGVLLEAADGLLPITYDPSADTDETQAEFERLFAYLTCSDDDKCNVLLWLMNIYLIGFSSSRPPLRLEGQTGTGKTQGMDGFSSLILGRETHSRFSMAACWALSATLPLLNMDNIEVEQQSDEMKTFLIVSATCGTNVKRQRGTDTGIVEEEPQCLTCQSGIEGLGSGIAEITNRQFVVPCSPDNLIDGFAPKTHFAAIVNARNRILSWMMACTARTLGYIQAGGLESAKDKIVKEFRDSNKIRNSEFLALMWLSSMAARRVDRANMDEELSKIPRGLSRWITSQDDIAKESGEDSPIVRGVRLLFQKYSTIALGNDDERRLFRQKFIVTFTDNGSAIVDAMATDLFAGLSAVFRDQAQNFPLKNSISVGRRLIQDEHLLADHGFILTKKRGRANKTFYTLERQG